MDRLDALRLRGLFAASALVSVGRSISIYYDTKTIFEVAAGLAVLTGASVIGLATGCTLMVHETRLAVQSLAQEGEIWKWQRSAGTPLPK